MPLDAMIPFISTYLSELNAANESEDFGAAAVKS